MLMNDPDRLWRTLVVVHDVHHSHVEVEVVAYGPEKCFVPVTAVPTALVEAFKGSEDVFRCHAKVNLGAESPQAFVFQEWEVP